MNPATCIVILKQNVPIARLRNNKDKRCREWKKKVEKIMAKAKGLYANIHAKKKRIAAGSGEKMRRPGAKGAPTKKAFVNSAKTAKKPKKKKA
mgnify:CR=1 FL=1